MVELAKERGCIIWFDGDRTRIRLALPHDPQPESAAMRTNPTTGQKEFHIPAPSAQRAEQIARAMRKT